MKPAHGRGLIRHGSLPGNTPGTGRPPDEFKKLCQHLATREETIAAVESILRDPNHPAYLGALRWATENGYGKPSQTIEHAGKITHGVVMLPPLGERGE